MDTTSLQSKTVPEPGERVDGDKDLEAELERGTRIGRYLVIKRIGSGGMGLVYAAYDPELNRQLAIKLIRSRFWHKSGRGRILREAQAMAKLSHPNVVSVYDVGPFGDQLFVAMELVEGQTLSDWLASEPRTWRDLLRVMLDAGRGIAAAHAAGIVHRDIKPANILVSGTGRAQVADFGVAQEVAEPEQADGVAGTPSYMAPEQEAGRAAQQSDQYAFCVTLEEALYGKRPVSVSSSKGALRSSEMPAGRPSAERSSKVVDRAPAWVRRVIHRGLREDPARRYPSMEALLAELDRTPKRRRVAAIAALTVAVVGGGAVAIASSTPGKVARCAAAAQAIQAVWSPRQSDALFLAFADTGVSHANDTARRVASLLDARAAAWAKTRRGVCEATWVRGEQSESLLDLRMQCLDRRRAETEALVELLSTNLDRALIDRAVQATRALEPVENCASLAPRLDNAYPGPKTPAAREKLAQVHKQVDELRLLHAAGRYSEGAAKTDALIAAAESLGDAPAQAELHYVASKLLLGAGDSQAAETMLASAVPIAARAKDHYMAARIAAQRIFVLGTPLGRHEEALALARDAEAAVIRAGDAPELWGAVWRSLGTVHITKGDYPRAYDYIQRSLARFEAVYAADDLRLASTLNNLSLSLSHLGRHAEAVATLERALRIWRENLGGGHPATGIGLNNLGAAYQQAHDNDKALNAYSQALELWEQTLGPNHQDYGLGLLNVGQILSEKGAFSKAEEHFRRALVINELRLDPNHPNLGLTLTFLASSLNAQKKYSDALPHHRRAVELLDAAVGPEHEYAGIASWGLGAALAQTGDLSSGLPLLERALTTLESHQSVYTEAAKFALAQALWQAGQDRDRARRLAQSARNGWADQKADPRHVKAVDAWLASR